MFIINAKFFLSSRFVKYFFIDEMLWTCCNERSKICRGERSKICLYGTKQIKTVVRVRK